MQEPQRGLRAIQVYRPCRISQWWQSTLNSAGTTFKSFSSTCFNIFTRRELGPI